MYQRGFTLIEVAMVLMIIGGLLSGMLVAFGQTAENTRRTTARVQLERMDEALYGFAQTHGRLPCPATSTSTGREAPFGGGVCTAWHGFVPVVELNLRGAVNADGLLIDPWGVPYRYSVGQSFTSEANVQAAFADVAAAAGLRVCTDNACGVGQITADIVPAVFLSIGANGADFTSANEVENAGGALDGVYRITTTNDFVSTDYNEETFDDIVYWLSPYLLFSRMISAGRLP